ncbi:DUF2884 family protein [Rheinheimera sp. MMS21-TC3]|uniref:DUF2884 family protein n=1 Tax=Rheinheimera sp. MMS21-TC3 TaxID=3072790 RepID=UPI0028C419DB|nr:DUF2884 family protein [Rheinheimera sp. MMS21-TC3]WNO59558.1 DUF2884 family protein [Rheinheimera sp. MMS21-TC3]
MKALLIAATLLIGTAFAHEQQCNIQLDKDLIVNADGVTIQNNNSELWRINSQGKLWIENKSITTNTATQKQLQQFQADIRQQTVQTLALVEDALVLASDAINTVVSELTGEPVSSTSALNAAVVKVKSYSESLILKQQNNITVYGSRFNTLDDVFDEAFEQAIKQAVSQSIGSLMQVVGKALTSGEGTFEQRMEAFAVKMENFATQLEKKVESQVSTLEHRGAALCDSLHKLDQLETDIQQTIPQMRQYDLIEIKQSNKA